jgi:hypothetical protein
MFRKFGILLIFCLCLTKAFGFELPCDSLLQLVGEGNLKRPNPVDAERSLIISKGTQSPDILATLTRTEPETTFQIPEKILESLRDESIIDDLLVDDHYSVQTFSVEDAKEMGVLAQFYLHDQPVLANPDVIQKYETPILVEHLSPDGSAVTFARLYSKGDPIGKIETQNQMKYKIQYSIDGTSTKAEIFMLKAEGAPQLIGTYLIESERILQNSKLKMSDLDISFTSAPSLSQISRDLHLPGGFFIYLRAEALKVIEKTAKPYTKKAAA